MAAGEETAQPAGDTSVAGASEAESWPRPGAKAILCNLGKFPKFNGQAVELASWNPEKQRWKCLLSNGGDVNVFVSNLEPAEMPEEMVRHLAALLDQGRIFEVWRALRSKSQAPTSLREALEAKLSPGTHAEIVEERLKLADIAGKGKGYRATKDIRRGEALLFNSAVASTVMPKAGVSSFAGQPDSSVNDPHKEMAKQIRDKMDQGWIDENIMCLKVGTPPAEGGYLAPLVRVLENSTFECTREPGRIAMFCAAARFNHSCCPNAYADATRSEVVIRALRDIPKGEEVCISYVPVSNSYKKRAEVLKCYGIECDCSRCKEDVSFDPEIKVPCKCGQFSFTMVKDQRLYQTCQHCFATFNREESEHHMSQISEANKKLYAALRSGENMEEHLQRLSKLEKYVTMGPPEGIPPMHAESMHFFSNLANLHYAAAKKAQGEARVEALKAFHRYKRLSIDKFEERHTTWTNQKDVDYFQVLHHILRSEGLSEELRQHYTAKLVEACRLHFGQPDIPATLT